MTTTTGPGLGSHSSAAGAGRGLRERILPRSALGIAVLLFFASLGAAFSGAVLFAYYQVRLDQNEETLTALVDQFDDAVANATGTIDAEREAAKEQIRQELEPLEQLAASGETITKLLGDAAPSVWFVATQDETGAPSVGSAFVVASDRDQTYLLTSYAVVRAATTAPAPAIRVRAGTEEKTATLWTWDEPRDLALLVLDQGNQPRLEWAGSAPSVGERVFVVSGLGTNGAAITQGSVADVSANGVQHDSSVGQAFRGGPLLNSRGEVVAVASTAYSPLGFTPGDVTFGIPVRDACQQVLRCPGGNGAQPGEQR